MTTIPNLSYDTAQQQEDDEEQQQQGSSNVAIDEEPPNHKKEEEEPFSEEEEESSSSSSEEAYAPSTTRRRRRSNNNLNSSRRRSSNVGGQPPIIQEEEEEESMSGVTTLCGGDLLREQQQGGSSSLHHHHLDSCDEEEVGFLQRLCLNARFSLRTYLMLSFGTVNALTILFVVGLCSVMAYSVGRTVTLLNQQSFQVLYNQQGRTTARLLAESLTLRLIPTDVITILYEATRDRFSGYPDYDDDSHVPFFDLTTQQNHYPIKGQPLPLDWQIRGTVNERNFLEHIPAHKWDWYAADDVLSTATAVYYMQGMCNPKAVSWDATYWPNCTAANNNITTGGVVMPSIMNAAIYNKAADLTPILKSLYEYHDDIQDLGIYFANDGAGSVVSFPAFSLTTSVEYTSEGCDWLVQSPHPYLQHTSIGTREQASKCQSAGTTKSHRLYNPLERGWCRQQAQNPHVIHVFGPFRDAWHNNNANNWVLGSGRAVYDRVTKQLIACIYVGSSVSTITLQEARMTPQSHVTLVKWEELGTVVASTAFSLQKVGQLQSVMDLGIGVSSEYWSKLLNLVNYNDDEWVPVQVQNFYESLTSQEKDGFSVSSYPIPPVPDTYDAAYHPEFVVIISTSQDIILSTVQVVNQTVKTSVTAVIYLALYVAAGGLVVCACIIGIMSFTLTSPLRYIHKASDEIMNNFGAATAQQKSTTRIQKRMSHGGCCCANNGGCPRTELGDVVQEFNKMILSFSGSNKKTTKQYREAPNDFRLQTYFRDLYFSRKEDAFPYKTNNIATITEQQQQQQEGEMTTIVFATPLYESNHDGLGKIHFGCNMIRAAATTTTSASVASSSAAAAAAAGVTTTAIKSNRASKQRSSHRLLLYDSPLFLWTVLMICTPLLLTTATISGVVLYTISRELDHTIQDSKRAFVQVELSALEIYTHLRANLIAANYMSRPLLRLHLLTRYTSWILFGGLEHATNDSYTAMETVAEECKTWTNWTDCGYPPEEEICDCAWHDTTFPTCHDGYTEEYGRRFQVTKWAVESWDSFPNGDRNYTSYPNVSNQPWTTAYWSDQTTVPGYNFSSGSGSGGYETTYDRLRAVSAIPVFALNFNSDPTKEFFMSNYISFEADGMFTGYMGCDKMGMHTWRSSEANGASLMRPELCPIGKWGYDPRCRIWYHFGRSLFLANHSVQQFITPPYRFALDNRIFAQTATAPLFDPVTMEHVGQTLIDFSTHFDSLSSASEDGDFPVLITPFSDTFGGNTVVGPGNTHFEDGAKPIAALVVPVDYNSCSSSSICNQRLAKFQAIVERMTRGERGVESFERSTTTTTGSDKLYIAYSPVVVHGFSPLDSSDFARSVQKTDYLVYSLGIARTEAGLLQPFQEVEHSMQQQIKSSIIILSIVIVIAMASVVWISYVVTLSFTHTVFFLLDWIRKINRFGGEPPRLDHNRMGCREMVKVADAMDSLYKVVRCGNANYYAGDIENAYLVLKDGLRMFRRLENKRAIAAACNNLGNTMLALYRALQASGCKTIAGMAKKEIIARGIVYYDDAIRIGEQLFNEMLEAPEWNQDCLEHRQHVANRHFNRGMFLLTVKEIHEKSPGRRQRGLQDLQVAHDIDAQLAAQSEQDNADECSADETTRRFNVALVRARGHMALLEMGYPDDFGVAEMIQTAFEMVLAELRDVHSQLFGAGGGSGGVRVVGMLQLIEAELIKYNLLKGQVRVAAQIGIRMLVEDEFIMCEAQVAAVKALVAFLNSPESGRETHNMARVRLMAYERTMFNHNGSNNDDMDTQKSYRSSSIGSSGGQESPSGNKPEFFKSKKKILQQHKSSVTADVSSSLSSRKSARQRYQAIRESVIREDVVMETF